MKTSALRRNQRGATLLIGLIILVLITLLAVTSLNLGKSNLQIVANQQFRGEAVESAKSALEEVLSHNDYSNTPEAPLRIYDAAGTSFALSNVKTYDVNGKGTAIVTVKVGETGNALNPQPCVKFSVDAPADPTNTATQGCARQQNQDLGIAGTSNAQCATNAWEITAVATDSSTQASVTVLQGIKVLEDKNVVANHPCL